MHVHKALAITRERQPSREGYFPVERPRANRFSILLTGATGLTVSPGRGMTVTWNSSGSTGTVELTLRSFVNSTINAA